MTCASGSPVFSELAHSRTNSPKTKNDASDNDCTNQRPNKYFEPSAAFNQVAKKVASNAAERSTDYSRGLVTLLDPIWSSGRQGDHWKGYVKAGSGEPSPADKDAVMPIVPAECAVRRTRAPIADEHRRRNARGASAASARRMIRSTRAAGSGGAPAIGWGRLRRAHGGYFKLA